MTQPGTAQIVFRPFYDPRSVPPLDRDRSDANQERQRAQIAGWEETFGPCDPDTGINFELFHDLAARLLAAIRFGRPVYVFHHDGSDRITHRINTDDELDPERPTIALGCFRWADPALSMPGLIFPDRVSRAGAEAYYELLAFRALSGRPMLLATLPRDCIWDDHRSVHRAVESLHARGHRKVYLSSTWPKSLTYVVTLPDVAPRNLIAEALESPLSKELTRPLRGKRTFLVWSHVPMTHEYTFVAVNGEIVAGAGAVDRMTPLDADGQFNPIMERRPGRDPAAPAPEVLDAYLPLARRFAALAAEEAPDLRHYLIDMAMGPNGPIIRTLQPMLNFSLCGMDYGFILAAILAGREPGAR